MPNINLNPGLNPDRDIDYDVVIIGGGLVGASFACAMSQAGFKIAVVEQHSPQLDSHPSYDDRTVALAYGSRLIFENMGLWSDISNYVTAIHNIHISDRGQFGVTRLSAKDQSVPALGYVIANRDLGRSLYEHLAGQKNISLLCPASIKTYEIKENTVQIEIARAQNKNNSEIMNTSLLIAADGIQSKVRELANIKIATKAYNQSAIICNISTDQAHHNLAYERFTQSGPIAFLPFSESANKEGAGQNDNRYSVVWTLADDEVDAIAELNDQDFLSRLQGLFGFRQGRLLNVGKRNLYPLSLMYANESVSDRIALIGNASHTLHPVAGQGFNLGLRDAAVLAEILIKAKAQQSEQAHDIGNSDLLMQYQQVRQSDHNKVIKLTDGLVRLFTYQFFITRHLRGIGLTLTDKLPALKALLARQTMGIENRLPRFKL